jgi:uncharacterized membrane protein/mono/diheme cytochrome c family protein
MIAPRRNRPTLLCGWLLFVFLAAAITASATGAMPVAPLPSTNIFQWRPFLAPFHALVLHLPIGFLAAAFVLEVYRLFRPGDELRRVTGLILWLSLVSGILAASLGIMRAGTGGYQEHALKLHRWFGLAVLGFTLATLLAQKLASRNETARGLTLAYRGLLAATLAMLVLAGHHGGNLTHGSKYLVENAPEFVREFLDEPTEPAPTPGAAVMNDNERCFSEKVQPVLSAKCYQCHGPEKQKGGYRLDAPELARKGGESGKAAIKPGDPLESHLVRLILLPRQHDDVMPPEGKQPLTIEEIASILDWIRNGAAFPETKPAATAGMKP